MSDLWATWMGTAEPLAVLEEADRDVARGRFRSREEAFRNLAEQVIRSRSPEMPYAIRPEKLGVLLQAYAESAEQVGP
jgi:hypothetical protein